MVKMVKSHWAFGRHCLGSRTMTSARFSSGIGSLAITQVREISVHPALCLDLRGIRPALYFCVIATFRWPDRGCQVHSSVY